MFKHLRWTQSLAFAVVTVIAVTGRLVAQTPEGTVITNTATAT
jgi:hypothetical protein